MIKEDVEEVLNHHGILGMRWGHRRQRLQDHLDRVDRVASGTATEQDRAAISSRRKTGLKVAGAATIAAGTVVAAVLLKKHGGELFHLSKNSPSVEVGKSWLGDPRNHQLMTLATISKSFTNPSGV